MPDWAGRAEGLSGGKAPKHGLPKEAMNEGSLYKIKTTPERWGFVPLSFSSGFAQGRFSPGQRHCNTPRNCQEYLQGKGSLPDFLQGLM
jgi:hypothetical protein